MEARINSFLDYLQVRNEYDQTLYGHLAQIIAKLLDDRPADAVAALGQISREIKASAGARGIQAAAPDLLSEAEWRRVDEVLALLSRPPVAAGAAADPEAPLVQDVVGLNEVLALLGRGLQADRVRLLQERVDEFAERRRADFREVNLFGVFATRDGGNYYVVEALPRDDY